MRENIRVLDTPLCISYYRASFMFKVHNLVESTHDMDENIRAIDTSLYIIYDIAGIMYEVQNLQLNTKFKTASTKFLQLHLRFKFPKLIYKVLDWYYRTTGYCCEVLIFALL